MNFNNLETYKYKSTFEMDDILSPPKRSSIESNKLHTSMDFTKLIPNLKIEKLVKQGRNVITPDLLETINRSVDVK